MKVYVAGPMSWYPGFNIPAFEAAAEYLRGQGFDVISPAELDGELAHRLASESPDGDPAPLADQGYAWDYFMMRNLRVLVTGQVDAVVLLPGWERSKGSRVEVGAAQGAGIQVHELVDYDPILGFPNDDDLGPLAPHAPKTNRLHETVVPWSPGELVTDPSGAVKADGGKPRMDLLPTPALLGTAAVLGFGAAKYADHNWRKGFGWSRIYGAALRHLTAWAEGEDLDPESGLPHLDHASCDVMFLQTFASTGTGTDDRYKKETA